MLAAELFQNGFLEREGYNSPTDCLRFNCHLTDKVASDRINVGEHLVELASGGKQANIQVTASIETLKGLAGAAAGEMEFSLAIYSLAVRRVDCVCSVNRGLLRQASLDMDVWLRA